MEVINFRSQLSNALEHVTMVLRQEMQSAVTGGRSLAKKAVHASFHVTRGHLRSLVMHSRDSIAAPSIRMTIKAFVGLKQAAIHVERAQNKILKLQSRVGDQPRQLAEVQRARENDLWELLASSPDAIVVTDDNRRFVEANLKALVLFGLSKANLRKFTLDIFFPRGQVPKSEGTSSPFKTRYGKCEIRRLDGSLQIAEYCLCPHFIPFQNIYKFHHIISIHGRGNLP